MRKLANVKVDCIQIQIEKNLLSAAVESQNLAPLLQASQSWHLGRIKTCLKLRFSPAKFFHGFTFILDRLGEAAHKCTDRNIIKRFSA